MLWLDSNFVGMGGTVGGRQKLSKIPGPNTFEGQWETRWFVWAYMTAQDFVKLYANPVGSFLATNGPDRTLPYRQLAAKYLIVAFGNRVHLQMVNAALERFKYSLPMAVKYLEEQLGKPGRLPLYFELGDKSSLSLDFLVDVRYWNEKLHSFIHTYCVIFSYNEFKIQLKSNDYV